jgi:hypothetical protein
MHLSNFFKRTKKKDPPPLLVGHQDLNLGPKDYESRHPKKTIRISRGYVS